MCVVYTCRGALDGLYTEFAKLSTDEVIYGEKRRRIIITILWFVTSLLFAIFTPNIGVVIELLGSLASANVFVFPSLCLIAIAKRQTNRKKITRIFFILFALTLIATGFFMFLLVLYQVYQDLVSPSQPTHEVLCKN